MIGVYNMWSQYIVDWQNGNQRSMIDPKDEEIQNLKKENKELKDQIKENEELISKIENAKHAKVLTKTKAA